MRLIVPGIVLCGGRSSRMGQPKALLTTLTSGETFVQRVVRVLRGGGVDDVVVVVGEEEAAISAALAAESPPPRLVVNPAPDRGQLSSLLVGLHALDHPGVSAVMMTLVDVPLVEPGVVKTLLQAHGRSRAPIVRPARDGRHGHPVIFDRAVFDELRQADLATGAKTVVRAHLDESVDVAVGVDGPFLDIDTPDDYQQAFGVPVPRVQST